MAPRLPVELTYELISKRGLADTDVLLLGVHCNGLEKPVVGDGGSFRMVSENERELQKRNGVL